MITLESAKGKNRKRLGRGISAGQGKTAGRGTKGQKSRAGYNLPRQHEGGQTPLSMRLPKLPGFKSIHAKAVTVTLEQISRLFEDGESISLETLRSKKVISRNQRVKLVNSGKLTVKAVLNPEVPASASVRELFLKSEAEKEELPIADKKISKTTGKA